MFSLFKNLKKQDFLIMLICVALICGQVYLDLTLPDFMSNITNLVMTGGNQGQIWIEGLKMLGCALGTAVLSIIVGFFSAKISSSFGMNLRGKVFNKFKNFSMQEIKNFSTPSLITRTTNDVTQVQMTIAMGLQVLIKAPILAVWAIVKILGKSWQWSIATAIAVLILMMLVLAITLFAIPKFRIIQKQTDDLNKVTRENLLGTRVVRAYNAEKYEEQRFEKVNTKLTNTHLYVSRIMSLLGPTMSLVMSGLSLSIYWIGAFLINGSGIMDRLPIFSDMVVFSQYAIQVVMAFIMLCMIFIILPRATVSARRINEVLHTKISITDGQAINFNQKDNLENIIDNNSIKNDNYLSNSQINNKNVEDININDISNSKINMQNEIKGEVEFKNVSFKYPDADEYVLQNVSFKANMGDTVAFIGSTGSGKSTLINLIPRFYDCTEGEILIDGINVKDYKLFDLNSKIGYVPQKAVIFAGTIKSNLTLGDVSNNISNEQLEKAISIAQSTEFVQKKDGKINAVITQGGSNLSGGQKQRLAIARAVAKKPEIYIFDDSFSALDYKTDLNLRKALKEHCTDSTKFIVAQRIGTIKDANLIIVLDEGIVVGMGSHQELLKNCDVYKEIALSQLSKEEL